MATINVKDAAGSVVAAELPLTPGRAAAANSRPVVISTEDLAVLGANAEAAPANDTAASGLNGRLQRIAQRLSSLIGLLPTALGQATMANSLSVALASNQSALPITDNAGSLTVDAPAATPVFVRLSDGAAAVTPLIGAQLPSSLGGKTAANSLSVTQASDSPLVTAMGTTADAAWTSGAGTQVSLLKAIAAAAIDTVTASPVRDANAGEYEFVAASATNQAIGATGAAGDWLSHIVIIPATTSPGAVSIKDGAGTAITVFTGGASSVTGLGPITVALDLKSVSGAWQVTTGTNVSVIAAGNFT